MAVVVVSLPSSQDLGTGPFLSLTKKFHGLSFFVLRRILILSSHIRLHFLGSLLTFFRQNLYLLAVKECNLAFT